MAIITKLWSCKRDLILTYCLILIFNSFFSHVNTAFTSTLPNYPDYYENDSITFECSPDDTKFELGTACILYPDPSGGSDQFAGCATDPLNPATPDVDGDTAMVDCSEFVMNKMLKVIFITETPNVNFTCKWWSGQYDVKYAASWVSPPEIKVPPEVVDFSNQKLEFYEGEPLTANIIADGGDPVTTRLNIKINKDDGFLLYSKNFTRSASDDFNNLEIGPALRTYDGANLSATSLEHYSYLTQNDLAGRVGPLTIYYVYFGEDGESVTIEKLINIQYMTVRLTCKPPNFSTNIEKISFQWLRSGVDSGNEVEFSLTQKKNVTIEAAICRLTAVDNPDYYREVRYLVKWGNYPLTNTAPTSSQETGVIIGAVVGVIVAVVLIIGIAIVVSKHRRANRDLPKPSQPHGNHNSALQHGDNSNENKADLLYTTLDFKDDPCKPVKSVDPEDRVVYETIDHIKTKQYNENNI